MNLQDILIKVGKILEKLNIPYCITGGYAVSVWGRPRGTFDVDIVIQLHTTRVAMFVKELQALSEAGYIEESVAQEAAKSGKEFNYFHPESGIKVDFWVIRPTDAMGVLELKNRISRKLDGHTIYFVSPEDLVLSKLRWYKDTHSTRQLEDIQSVFAMQKKLDMTYINEQAKAQATADILKEILHPKE